VKGARITVRCDCGEVNYVEYGETWQCPKCDRRWNTLQIPSDEYWGIMDEMRQFRVQAMTVALCIGGAFAALALTLSFSFFLFLPAFMTAWYIFYMPRWRRRVRQRARSLPEWTLHPE
jgi:fatty acid desaturase